MVRRRRLAWLTAAAVVPLMALAFAGPASASPARPAAPSSPQVTAAPGINTTSDWFICQNTDEECMIDPDSGNQVQTQSATLDFFTFTKVGTVDSDGSPFIAGFGGTYGGKTIYQINVEGGAGGDCLSYRQLTELKDDPCDGLTDQEFVWLGNWLVNIGASNSFDQPPFGAAAETLVYGNGRLVYFDIDQPINQDDQWSGVCDGCT